jgi:xanthine dehydrogenase molybdopterin-binding subunit B
MEVEVDRGSGEIAVRRVCCAHDCGLMINPDAVRAQVEGNILQTLSRTLYEETTFDRARVTSVDWASYRLLRFPAVPRLEIALIDRPDQPPLGAGEAAASPVPAALANAVSTPPAFACAAFPSAPASSRHCSPEPSPGRAGAGRLSSPPCTCRRRRTPSPCPRAARGPAS